jgi:hypothetical protein
VSGAGRRYGRSESKPKFTAFSLPEAPVTSITQDRHVDSIKEALHLLLSAKFILIRFVSRSKVVLNVCNTNYEENLSS